MVVVAVRARVLEHELQLADVVAPGGEQAVAGERLRRIRLAAGHAVSGDPLPQSGRRVQQE
jgi:hypothetical protein